MSTQNTCPFCGDLTCCGPAPNEVRRLVQTPKCRDLEMNRVTERIQRLEAEIKAMRERKEAKP